MKAVVNPAVAAAPHRVDTLSCFSPSPLRCRTNNIANGSGCLVTQAVAQRTGGALHRVLDAGRPMQHKYQKLHSSTFACRCLASASGGSEEDDGSNVPREGADGETEDQAETSSYLWDLPSRHQRMQAAAAKVGDPLRDMVSIASKKLQCYLEDHHHVKISEEADNELEKESDWARWEKVFAEVETNESLSTMLTFQLDEAVEKEDFEEAARLKAALDAVTEKDVVAEVTSELKKALTEERYDDAAFFRDKAGAGLIGWWAGLAEGENDPYGRIVHIHAAHGRLVAKGYSARQLATAAPGVPLFEIFLTKTGERDYEQQAVYLQRDRTVAKEPSPASTKDVGLGVENSARDEDRSDATKELSEDILENGKGKDRDAAILDESLSKIMSFLTGRMPDVKTKLFKVIAPEGEISKIIEQLMEQEDSSGNIQQDLPEASTSGNINSTSEKKGLGSKFPLDGNIPVGGIGGVDKEASIRLVVGGVLQNSVDSEPPKLPVLVPATIEHQGRNAFTFHVDDPGSTATSTGAVPSKELTPSPNVSIIITQTSADLMLNDVVKVLSNAEKQPLKVFSKEMGEIIRLGSSLAQRRHGLFTSTNFRRINVSESSTDPLCGLFIGAFGPYTSEVVQLQRKYGHWESDEAKSSGQNLEFFEYVEAVKLTGDLNVPAGQVTFRARIGRESRLSQRGAYPEELGVATRYKGQGRLAEPGFRNPQWIDGELVLLDGKGGGYTNGAALGFVYSVPERHFLVLFRRLNLSLD